MMPRTSESSCHECRAACDRAQHRKSRAVGVRVEGQAFPLKDREADFRRVMPGLIGDAVGCVRVVSARRTEAAGLVGADRDRIVRPDRSQTVSYRITFEGRRQVSVVVARSITSEWGPIRRGDCAKSVSAGKGGELGRRRTFRSARTRGTRGTALQVLGCCV